MKRTKQNLFFVQVGTFNVLAVYVLPYWGVYFLKLATVAEC